LGRKSGREEDIIERRKKEPPGSFFYSGAAGFTIAELVAVLIIAGVLAAVAVPRLGTFGAAQDEVKLYDQTLAALRYAQKAALAMQHTVCATFSGGTTLTLTYASVYGSAICDANLMPPGGAGAPYTVVRQGSAGYTAAAPFSYDRVGRPSAAQTISLAGGRAITVEAETGYVR